MSELIQNPKDIQLNEQQEIQQIMGDPPGWMLRYGIMILFVLFMGLLYLAWLVEYPDAIPAEVKLRSANPPIHIKAEQDGKLVYIPVKENDLVEIGDELARYDNAAQEEDVQLLKRFLEETSAEDLEDGLEIPNNLSLGDLQTAWSAFSENYQTYLSAQENDDTKDQIRYKRQKISNIRALNASLADQIQMAKKEEHNADVNLARGRKLEKEGTISTLNLEKIESEYFAKQRQVKRLEAQINENNIRKEQIKEEISDLREKNTDEGDSQLVRAKEDLQRLKSKIDTWEQSFIIKAKNAGKVTFPRPLDENSYLEKGESILTIIPQHNSDEVIGEAFIAFSGRGKVKKGHEVHISIAAYPRTEYGILKGTVASLPEVPQGNKYLINIELPNDLVTTRDSTITLLQEMQGTAEIITDKRRYLERILDKLFSAWKDI